jgi:hypothetical protein
MHRWYLRLILNDTASMLTVARGRPIRHHRCEDTPS